MENYRNMSLSPHQIFGRLQELKKWQQTHEKLFQRSDVKQDRRKNAIESPNNNSNIVNLDEQYVNAPLDKNFEELLEEKLNECNEYNIVTNDVSVPKKPFLKKGTGLLKYKLKPEEYKTLIGNKYSNTVSPKNRRASFETKNKVVQFQKERPKSTGNISKSVPPKKRLSCVKSIRTSSQKLRSVSSEGSQRREQQNKTNNCNKKEIQRSISNGRNSINNHNHSKEKIIQNEKESRLNVEESRRKSGESLRNSEKIKKVDENEIKPDKSTVKLHDFLTGMVDKPAEYTPLRVPEISIKPKGNWCDVSLNDFQNEVWKTMTDVAQKNDAHKYENTAQFDQALIRSQWKNDLENDKLSGLEGEENSSGNRTKSARKSLSYTSNDNSLYEQSVENELKIFEALEKKTEQSGFCSTNTSVIQLLASTPSRFNFNIRDWNVGNKMENGTNKDYRMLEKLGYRLDDWRNAEDSTNSPNNWHMPYGSETEDSEEFETEEETDRTLGDNERESEENHKEEIRKDSDEFRESNGMLPSSYSSTSSEVSSNYLLETSKDCRLSKSPVEAGNLEPSASCANCGSLMSNKIEECQRELENLKIEKDKIVAIREGMERDRNEFEKEMKLKRIQFEEMKLKYQLETEEGRKKMADMKEASEKNKETAKSKRREKDEMNNLRIELSETKELMKLRDTKNAMTVARLRNQVKMLEKNNAELKAENEKLMREKSKLVAQQKSMTKTNETKMLKEISKNISRLTEGTIKNLKPEDVKRKLVKGESEANCSVRGRTNSQGILMEERMESSIGKSFRTADSDIEEKYKSLFSGNEAVIEENSLGNTTRSVGLEKSERILEDGTKEIKYSNGNIKRISENGTMRYYYSGNDTWHTNFPDGTEVIEFPNGQSEKRFKDGKCLIFFPDGLIQTIFPDGAEEIKYPDGSKMLTKKDGDRFLFLTNGQVEIHTKDQKRREYPDGTVKILYPDGSQETRYSNGRIRMKNSEGHIILDTGGSDT